MLDPAAKVARVVEYRLTGPHTLGCGSRKGMTFQVDKLASADGQGSKSDYSHSGYDLGHMAPNADFAWSDTQQRDIFSMANVAPQLHGLNAQGWERGEETVRAWAYERGKVVVYVGAIIAAGADTIGDNAVTVPSAFFKVVVDANAGEAIAFQMPNSDVPKGDLTPYLRKVSDTERDAGIVRPLPQNVDAGATSALWSANLTAWRKVRKDHYSQ